MTQKDRGKLEQQFQRERPCKDGGRDGFPAPPESGREESNGFFDILLSIFMSSFFTEVGKKKYIILFHIIVLKLKYI